MSSETAADTSAVENKICQGCGADITRKPRQKDAKGRYWCVPCARSGTQKEGQPVRQSSRAQCPDCGQKFPPEAMIRFEDTLICEPCRQVRIQERAKALARREQAASGGEEERKQSTRLIVLIIVAGLLGAFATYWNFFANK